MLMFAVVFAIAAIVPFSMHEAFGNTALAQTPNTTVNYQARLLLASGALVPDGYYNVEFKLYDSISGGASAQGTCVGGVTDDCVWIETRDYNGGTPDRRVRVVNGYLSVNLGSVAAFGSTIPWNQDLYVTMRIGGSGTSPSWDTEMVNSGNRMKLSAVPYAFRARELIDTDSGFESRLTFDTPTQNNAIVLPDDSGTVCLTSGNCAGVGGVGDILDGGQAGAISIGTTDNTTLTLLQNGSAALTVNASQLLRFNAYNCSTFANGGTLTTDGSGNVTCADDDGGGGGSGDSISINGSAVTDLNLLDSSATGTAAGISLNLNTTPSPDELTLTVSNASDTIAGVVTTGAQTFAGLKTFNNGLTIAASQLLSINADSFDDLTGAGLVISSGDLQVDTSSSSGAFINGGNAFTANSSIGNTGSYSLAIKTNNQNRILFGAAGAITLYEDTVLDGNLTVETAGSNASILLGSDTSGVNDQFVISVSEAYGFSVNEYGSAIPRFNIELAGTTTLRTASQSFNILNGSSSNIFRVDTGSGMVGINDPSPSVALDVNGSGAFTGVLAVNGDNISADSNLTINGNGYVRIGDTGTPNLATTDDDLYVEGDVEFDSTFSVAAGATFFSTVAVQGSSLTLGSIASTNGVLTLLNSSNAHGVSINASAQTTGSATISLPNTLGSNDTFCLYTLNNCGAGATGFIDEGNSFSNTAVLGTNDSNSLVFETNNQSAATIAVGGATIFQNSANSTTAFRVLNSAATSTILNVDTSNVRVGIGTASPSATLQVSGNQSSGSWGVSGIGLRLSGSTYTDTTSSGTVANVVGNSFGQPTFAANSATTYTDATTLYVANAPLNGANVTITNAYALQVASGTTLLGGNLIVNGSQTTIGDATTDRLTVTAQLTGASPLVFQGVTNDSNFTTLAVTDPTSTNTITLPNSSGSVVLSTTGSSVVGTSAFVQGGNTWAGTATIGTNDSNTLAFETNNQTIMTIASGGAINVQNTADSTAAFNVRNQAGVALFVVDTTNNRVGTGSTTGAATNSQQLIIRTGDATGTGSNTGDILLRSGTSSSGTSGNISLEAGGFGTTAGTVNIGAAYRSAAINIGIVGSSAIQSSVNIANTSGNAVQSVSIGSTTNANSSVSIAAGSTGGITMTSNSTVLNAISTSSTQIEVRDGSSSTLTLLVADSANDRIYIGDTTADTTGALLVLDTKNDSGDPSGVNGGMYYNSNTGKFRCYEGGTWKDCLAGGGANTALSNLTTTSINQDLLPAADDTYDLGSTSLRWQDLYLGPASLHVYCSVAECTSARDWSLGVIETDGTTEGNLRLGLAGADNLVITTAGNAQVQGTYGFTGNTTGEKINLYSTSYGIGIESSTFLQWGNQFRWRTTSSVGTEIALLSATNFQIDGTLTVDGTGASTIAGPLTVTTLNTGQGATEVYAMNQDVQTSNAVTFTTINTGQGANELYDMDQNVLTTSNVEFGRVTIGLSHFDGALQTDGITGYLYANSEFVAQGGLQANGRIFAQNTSSVGTTNNLCYGTEAGSGIDGATSIAGFGACSSLSKYKDNQVDLSLGLLEVRMLRAREFDWNTQNGKHDFGFIAEEVEGVNPLLADYDSSGVLQGVKYMQMTALLTKAIQQLDVQVQANDTRLAVLEAGNFSGSVLVAQDVWVGDDLTVTDDATIQSNLTVLGSTSVRDITVTGKIITTGSVPTAVLGAQATGLGASATISGNNSAGTIQYSAGTTQLPTNPIVSGAQVRVAFTATYASQPRISLTAKDESSASIRYFVETDNNGFTVHFLDAPAAGSSYTFDYIVIQ